MNILLTNDDGVDSPGVQILAGWLAPLAKLWVCAPKAQQSGSGHGITVRDSILVREEKIGGAEKAWSVEGKPADCVKIALLALLPEPVDIVISGINEGTNLGTDTLYSGTVAAAMEGALHRLPALALSLHTEGQDGGAPDYGQAAEIGVTLFSHWVAGRLPIPPMSVLNVNIPYLSEGRIKGFKAAGLGLPRYSDRYDQLEGNGDGRRYRLSGSRLPSLELDSGLDTVALEEGYVTLTPLSVFMTDHALFGEVEKFVEGRKGIR